MTDSKCFFLIGTLTSIRHSRRVNTPLLEKNRVEALDLVRGIAVCGLVPINSIDFGFGSMLLLYPLDLAGADRTLWMLLMGLGAGKFATLFASLFGAGMILFCGRAEASGRSAASRYLPRLAWLFVIGVLHAYLIWYGDILVSYAVTGFVLFWCRNWSAKVFLIIGSALLFTFVFPLVVGAVICHFVDFPLTEEWTELAVTIRSEGLKETAALTGSWVEQMKARATYALLIHLLGIPLYLFWFAAMFMCFGIALMKSGFFTGGWSDRRLGKTTTLLLVTGLPLTLGGYAVFAYAAPTPVLLIWGYAASFTGMPLVAYGYAGLGVMWSRRENAGILRRSIAAVGRMALTNYIAQSVLLGLIYYGHGLALRGQIQFYEAMLIAPAIWVFQMAASNFWLRHHSHGPLEWLWRRLTYGRTVSIRKSPSPPPLP